MHIGQDLIRMSPTPLRETEAKAEVGADEEEGEGEEEEVEAEGEVEEETRESRETSRFTNYHGAPQISSTNTTLGVSNVTY